MARRNDALKAAGFGLSGGAGALLIGWTLRDPLVTIGILLILLCLIGTDMLAERGRKR